MRHSGAILNMVLEVSVPCFHSMLYCHHFMPILHHFLHCPCDLSIVVTINITLNITITIIINNFRINKTYKYGYAFLSIFNTESISIAGIQM